MVSTCSADWADPTIPIWGTATRARFWVGMEQPGPWGTKAFTQSRMLDPQVGAEIEQWCLQRGGRFLLLRSPGGADEPGTLRRKVFVAGNLAEQPWLGTTTITGPAALLGLLNQFEVDATTRPAGLDHHPAILTVCTNGRRDQCCAQGGLALGKELMDANPGQIWECSHLGGHRFAPTALLWPTGQVLGRLNPKAAAEGLRLAERCLIWGAGPAHDRGCSHLEPARQAAESFVRAQLPPQPPSAISSISADDPNRIRVAHLDGRIWQLQVIRETLPQDRLESCGKPALTSQVWRVSTAEKLFHQD